MDICQVVQDRVLVFDGGFGTMLIARGLASGQPGDLWNLERPQVVEEVHRLYVQAGADAATTNTFGANAMKLAKTGLADRCGEINRTAARLARSASGPDHFVVGDIGPTGEMRAPMGTCETGDFYAAFVEQAEHLEAEGVDAYIIETMYDVEEALAALDAVHSVTTQPVIACMTFGDRGQGFFSLMGDRPAVALRRLQDAGAWAVGANCSIGSERMVPLAAEIRAAVTCPVIVQPNAGMPEVVDGAVRYPEEPAGFARNIRRAVAEGVNMVGGCCGTTPEFTAAIVRALRE